MKNTCLIAMLMLELPLKCDVLTAKLGIANAWKRLEQGTCTEADRQLLRHEAAEAYLMRQWQDPSYNRAHTRTQKRFPAPYLEE